jgi:hypothetical protein
VVRGLLQATAAEEAGDRSGAMAALQGLIDAPGTPQIYRELARLKLVTLAGTAMDAPTRDAILADLARPGATFRLLAEEQQALILLGAGQTAEAVERLEAIAEDAEAPNALRGRVEQILTAVGAGPAPAGQQTE